MARRLIVLIAVLLLTQALVIAFDRPEPIPLRQPLQSLPVRLGAWRDVADTPLDSETLAVLKPDDYVLRRYRNGPAEAELFIGYYASQRQGDSIHSPLNCLPAAGWTPVALSRTTVPTSAGNVLTNQDVVAQGLDRRLVLYWYQSHGRTTASEYLSRIYLVLDGMRLHRTDAAIVRVAVADGIEAERRAENFVQALYPALQSYLPESP